MIFNVTGGGAGSGGTLVVTAPAGVTCTVSKDGKTKSKTVDQYGYATFKGLDTGTWTVVITDGSQTSPARQVVVTADYDVTMSFFSATIVVTYPEGSTCTCSDGTTTLTAPDTSGSHTFVVPNAGTWTVSCTDGDSTGSQAVTITTNGESQSVALGYNVLYDEGNEYTNRTGGWEITGVGSKNEKSIIVGGKSAVLTGTNAAQTAKKIDLTAYNTIVVHITAAKNNSSGGSVFAAIFDGTNDIVTTKIGSSKFELSSATDILLDASALSGSYYVRVVTKESAVVSHTVYAEFDRVECKV